jgi:hypothetical protein
MGIELSTEQLIEICAHARVQMQASQVEYGRLLDVLREKFPPLTDDVIATTLKNLVQGNHHDDGQTATHAALCCAYYQMAAGISRRCVEQLESGSADGTVFQNLLWNTSGAFEALGALALVLNGGPIAQSFIDQGIKQQAVARAMRAATMKHATTNEAKLWAQQQWRDHAARFHNNKSAFARHYVEQVKAEFPGVKIEEKTVAEVWLSPAALN